MMKVGRCVSEVVHCTCTMKNGSERTVVSHGTFSNDTTREYHCTSSSCLLQHSHHNVRRVSASYLSCIAPRMQSTLFVIVLEYFAKHFKILDAPRRSEPRSLNRTAWKLFIRAFHSSARLLASQHI